MKHFCDFSRLLPVAFFSGTVATTSFLGLSRPVQASLQDSPKAVLDQAWQIVNREYVDTAFNQVNWQAARQELLSRNYTNTAEAWATPTLVFLIPTSLNL
jgi:carboxyl-terminal processing protease